MMIMKVLRAVRPLRISTAGALRDTVQTLIVSMPDMMLIMMLNLVFIYIFSIIGVQLLEGRTSFCSVKSLTTKS